MTTKELYEHVIKFLGITEKSLFGLAKVEGLNDFNEISLDLIVHCILLFLYIDFLIFFR